MTLTEANDSRLKIVEANGRRHISVAINQEGSRPSRKIEARALPQMAKHGVLPVLFERGRDSGGASLQGILVVG